MVAAVAGAATGLFLVKNKLSARKREELFSKVDVKSLNIDDFELQEEERPKWDTIQTKAPTVVQEGFQFAAEEAPLILEEYWDQKVGLLISQAVKYELENENAKALQIYSILIRMAKKIENTLLRMSLEAKKSEIFERLSKEE